AICRLRVLALSGRFSVTTATAPRVSTWTLGAATALLVGRASHAQAGQLRRELDLAGQAGVVLVVRQLRQQLALVGPNGGAGRPPFPGARRHQGGGGPT